MKSNPFDWEDIEYSVIGMTCIWYFWSSMRKHKEPKFKVEVQIRWQRARRQAECERDQIFLVCFQD